MKTVQERILRRQRMVALRIQGLSYEAIGRTENPRLSRARIQQILSQPVGKGHKRKEPTMDNGEWQTDSADAHRNNLSGPQPVGVCEICKTPVLPEHDPVEVHLDGGAKALIHGSFDCMDEPRCGESKSGYAYGLEASQRCVLPAPHTGECYWGPVA